MNPVLFKELRSLLRERRGWLVPMAYATLLGGAFAMFLVPQLAIDESLPPRMLGRILLGTLAVVQAIVVGVVAPLVGASTIAGERERSTWLSLLASPVSRGQIASGKLVGATLYVLLLMAVSVPLAALSLFLGAVDLRGLVGLYLAQGALAVALVAIGVAASTLFHRTWTATLVALGLTFSLALADLVLIAGALVVAEAMKTEDKVGLYFWLATANPFFGLFAFFASTGAKVQELFWWWIHLGCLGLYTLVAVGFTRWRLGRLVE